MIKKEKSAENLSVQKIFDMFDEGSGTVNFESFTEMLKYMNMDISPHKTLKIFSEVANEQDKVDRDGFEKAIVILHKQVAGRVLDVMGLSVARLVKVFLTLLLLLLALFIFIFLGIAAFANNSAFVSVVNSTMPCGAAVGVGSQTQVNDNKEISTKAQSHVDKVLSMIKKVT